jgi:putative component of membrane protein insertase Oxa1/YidC/SpoIIIJ protein YidD
MLKYSSFVCEQIIKDYCLHRKLTRPAVNLYKVVGIIVLAEFIVLIISFFIHGQMGIDFWMCQQVVNLFLLLLFGTPICKLGVRLYQRYASEQTRRRCHCMPSCSEYALLALDKYMWPKALWLIYRRLTHTCSLPGYKVDYP